MASSSHLDTSVADSADSGKDEFGIALKEFDESLEKLKFGLEEKEKKTEQKKRVKASITSLKVTLEEKEQELEKKKKKLVGRNRSLMIEIEEEVDDIKVLKEVMRMKEMEKEKWNEDLKAARKDCNATSLHMYKLSKKLNELHAKRVEKRDRKEEGEATNDESK
ncbi:unnamed protein product [Caenorhabditis brenneri]